MGRKIPGAKHRGIKDPDKQRAQRLAKLGLNRNEPPKDNDEQLVPKSLQRLMQLKNDVNFGQKKIKKKKSRSKNKLIKIGGREENSVQNSVNSKRKPEKNVPVFNQKPNESNQAFWNRVNRQTQNFLNETTFEDKFNVSVKRNSKTGQIEGIEKRPKDEIDELIKLKNSKHKNIKSKKKKKQDTPVAPKLTKSQKRKQKLEIKAANKSQEDVDDFKTFRDEIGFGEIIHAPPTLKIPRSVTVKNRNTQSATEKLLLRSLLNDGNKDSR